MKATILTVLFSLFLLSLEAQSQLSCDSEQIKNSKLSHSPEIIIKSVQEIFDHFYQTPEAFYKVPYEFLSQGELQGYKTQRNDISDGLNAYVDNLQLAQNSQYYINCKDDSKPSICQNPPSYTWGGMGWYERDSENKLSLNLHGNDEMTTKLSKGRPGLDCSGFTYAVFSNAKLRVTTDLNLTPSFKTADNTPARSYMNLDDKSCFREINFGKHPQRDLQQGDIITWKTHMVILDTIGKDPFGIGHIASIGDCRVAKIKPENSTLTFFNSKGGFEPHKRATLRTYGINYYFNEAHKAYMKQLKKFSKIGIGISKQNAKEFFYTSPQTFFSLAINFCKAKFTNVSNLDQVKIIRHKAFYQDEKAPCECFAREQDYLELRP
jgi:hypothetical protein